MSQLPTSIILAIALLTVFLCISVALKYVVHNNFVRTRCIMTTFFCFIVLTLTISFWQYTVQSLPFTIPAWCLGIAVGYWFGVRTEQQKLKMHGIEHYLEHFAHVHMTDITKLNWWSVINFYTIMGGLLLINLVGLSTVIFHNVEYSAIRTTGVGAFLLGTILPYMIHLWSIKAPHNNNSMASE